MAADNWRELLDDPEIERIIGQVYNRTGRHYYARPTDALLLDDLTSWLWDRAVDIAIGWDPTHLEHIENPTTYFYAYLHAALRRAIITGQHHTELTGEPGSAKNNAHNAGIDSIDERLDEYGAPIEHSWFKHRLTQADPLVIVLRCEHLEDMLRHATATADGTHNPPPDQLCAEPICRNLAARAGYCHKHYQRERQHWTELCEIDGCTRGSIAKNRCSRHYHQLNAQDPTRPRCDEPNCDRAVRTRGKCASHYTLARRQARKEAQQ